MSVRLKLIPLILAMLFQISPKIHAANWQYRVDVAQAVGKDGKPRESGSALLWMPPKAQVLRGLLICGRLKIEGEMVIDPQVRAVCTEARIGIVYFDPHIDGVFHFWEEGNTSGARWLKALDDLSERTGHQEIRRVPWITMGHSTAGIFCRNVAYWKPDRVAAIVHIKSGNFHQKSSTPPQGSLKGIPLISINGQFETFGPESGINPEWGRETQWICAQKDIQLFRSQDPEFLMAEYVHLGEDHFHGSPELAKFVALFLKKTAQYRLPEELSAGDGSVTPLPIKAASGWLVDGDLKESKYPAASFAEFQGNKSQAMWLYDQELCKAYLHDQQAMSKHQALENPTIAWINEGDGWSFKVNSHFLDVMPDAYGGRVGGKPAGHADGPVVYRSRISEPISQLGPDTFRVNRITKELNIGVYQPGNDQFHTATRWSKIPATTKGGTGQSIQFPGIPNSTLESFPMKLEAKATSNLPVYYEVDYGPVEIREGVLQISEIPADAKFPLDCRVTAYQIGRRIEPGVNPAPPVSQTFQILR